MIAAAIRTNVRPWTPTVYAEPPFRTGLPSPVQEQFCFFRPHPARDCPAPCKKNKKSARTPPAPTGPAPPWAEKQICFPPDPSPPRDPPRPGQDKTNLSARARSAPCKKTTTQTAGKIVFRQPQKRTHFRGGQEKFVFSVRGGKKKQISFLFSLSARTTRKN